MLPLAHAELFVAAAGGFGSAEQVLKGGVHMAATEVAAEPLVRQEVRKQYQVRRPGEEGGGPRRSCLR